MIKSENKSKVKQRNLKPTHVNFRTGTFVVTKWDENNAPIQLRTPNDEFLDITVFPRQKSEKR